MGLSQPFFEFCKVQADPTRLAAKAIPKAQRAVAGTWDQYLKSGNGDRNAALYSAYRSGGVHQDATGRADRAVDVACQPVDREGGGEERGDLTQGPISARAAPWRLKTVCRCAVCFLSHRTFHLSTAWNSRIQLNHQYRKTRTAAL